MTVPIPPLAPDAPPLAFLVDYDGTIALTDVTDEVLTEHFPDAWEDLDLLYDDGLVGSRWLMERQVRRLAADPAALLASAARQPHDPGFVPFVRRALGAGIPVEVVSDGFGFFIEPALRRLGLPEVPVASALTTLAASGSTMTFPNGNADCLLCGTCKRDRVLAHQAAGRQVVFVGDGVSDRYAAGYADRIFAKRHLRTICASEGLPFTPFERFDEVERWLADILAAWADDPGSIAPPRARPFFCGAEVWGPGRRGEPGEDWPTAGRPPVVATAG